MGMSVGEAGRRAMVVFLGWGWGWEGMVERDRGEDEGLFVDYFEKIAYWRGL